MANADLPEVIRRVILAHELGHADLHRGNEILAFNERMLFDETSRYEKEANMYAAELLLDDESVVNSMEQMTLQSIAEKLNVPVELLVYKLQIMKWKGYKLPELSFQSRCDFLKDMEVPDNYDDHVC